MNVIIGALNFTSLNLILFISLQCGITMQRNSVQRVMHAVMPGSDLTDRTRTGHGQAADRTRTVRGPVYF
jgi:hypothetical protein